MPSPLEIADDKLRAAHAALAERKRLTSIVDALAPDLAEAEQDVAAREAEFATETKDVVRYQRGVWAFLYGVFADRDGRLTKEQQEADAAQLRLVETTALRDRLREEIASLRTRIAPLGNAEREIEVARAGKQAVLVATGSPHADELDTLSAELGKVSAMGRELEEALSAGQRAHSTLTQLTEVLASARNWGTWDIMSDNMLVSWEKRNKLDQARSIAGTAQAELTVFSRELGDLGLTLSAEITVLADSQRFLDVWFDNIFSDLAVQSRIKSAQETTSSTLAAVATTLDELRRTIEGISTRSRELAQRRIALLER